MTNSLEAIVTLNLWEDNLWNERKDILINQLAQNSFSADHTVAIALQEVHKGLPDTIFDLADGLGFRREQAYFFPTTLDHHTGLGLITNLPVDNVTYINFSHDISDPLEFGQRGIGLVRSYSTNSKLVIGVTHLSVSGIMQMIQGNECLNAVKTYCQQIPDFNIKDNCFTDILSDIKILIAGDFNADIHTGVYREFCDWGLKDLTAVLRKKKAYTWPIDIEWFLEANIKIWGTPPIYNIKQRWIDYIWGVNFSSSQSQMIGQKINNIYPSDHYAPAVYF